MSDYQTELVDRVNDDDADVLAFGVGAGPIDPTPDLIVDDGRVSHTLLLHRTDGNRVVFELPEFRELVRLCDNSPRSAYPCLAVKFDGCRIIASPG